MSNDDGLCRRNFQVKWRQSYSEDVFYIPIETNIWYRTSTYYVLVSLCTIPIVLYLVFS